MATAAARSWPPPRASDRLRPTLTAPPVDPDAETQNHQVQDHLDHDEHAGALAGRGDVTEPDREQTVRVKYSASVRVSSWVLKLAALPGPERHSRS